MEFPLSPAVCARCNNFWSRERQFRESVPAFLHTYSDESGAYPRAPLFPPALHDRVNS